MVTTVPGDPDQIILPEQGESSEALTTVKTAKQHGGEAANSPRPSSSRIQPSWGQEPKSNLRIGASG
jgi:hypothetical protein